MAEVAPAPTVVPAKAPKKKAASRTKKTGPSVGELIVKAVSSSKERSGVSLAALKKALAAGGYDVEKNNSRVKLAVKGLVTKGTLVQTKGIGASGSFKLNKQTEVKKPAKKAAPKTTKAAAKKRAAAKKPKKVAAKKPAAKKSPKKTKKPVAAAKKATKSPKKAAKKPATPKKAAKSPKKAAKKPATPKKVKAVKPKTAKPKAVKAKKAPKKK